MAIAVLALATTFGQASATTFNGPLKTIVDSGQTICDTQKDSWMTVPAKNVIAESTHVWPTWESPTFARARRTVHFWLLPKNGTVWQHYPRVQEAYVSAAMATALTFGTMKLSLKSGFSGQAMSYEVIELLDRYGRVIEGGTSGRWEDQYRTNIYSYSPSISVSEPGFCIF